MDSRINETLIINRYDSKCGCCGKGASTEQVEHDKALGWGNQGKGCGVKFKYVSSSYTGMDQRVAAMRPDLELIPGQVLYGS